MEVLKNVDLFKDNTMRLHCLVDVVLYPRNIDELKECISNNPNALFLAAGSNVLLPKHLLRPIINLMQLDNIIGIIADGRVRAGCSVRIQKLIRFLQNSGLGGIEYLYSVPASVGGLVYMNGGRGREHNMAISDFLDSVEYLDLDDMTVKKYVAKRDDFSYRHSLFQEMNAIIIAAYFRFKEQDAEVTESLIKDRLAYSKRYLSADKPSCGTAFCKGNRYLFRLLRGMRVGGAMFSKKTSNWISNVDNATYEDICKLIERTQKIHKLFFCECKPEIKIIKD